MYMSWLILVSSNSLLSSSAVVPRVSVSVTTEAAVTVTEPTTVTATQPTTVMVTKSVTVTQTVTTSVTTGSTGLGPDAPASASMQFCCCC